MIFFKLVSGVMLSDEGRYPYQFDTEWVSRGDAELEINNQTAALIEELEKVDKRESDANNNCDALRLSVEVAKKVTLELETQRDEANIKGHRAVLLCMEAEDREW